MTIESVQFPAAVGGTAWKRFVKVALGRCIGVCAPRYVARIAAGRLPARIGVLESCVISALVDRHSRARTLGDLAPLHAWLWSGEQAVAFHEQARSRFDSWWVARHSAIVAPLQRLVGVPGSPLRHLCEIGCGSGLVLEDLARRLPTLESLIGLDLSPTQTARNRERVVDSRVRFETGDAVTWVPVHGKAGTIYMTVAGVFEYLPRPDLAALFAHVATHHHPAVVAVVEPLPADFDLETEMESRPYGYENSLGHNYRRLLHDSGFDVVFEENQQVDGQRFLLAVATSRDRSAIW